MEARASKSAFWWVVITVSSGFLAVTGFASGTGVMLGVDPLQPGPGVVGVELGGGDVGVSQHHLDRPQIRPADQEMGGEGMAQDMGRDLGPYSGL